MRPSRILSVLRSILPSILSTILPTIFLGALIVSLSACNNGKESKESKAYQNARLNNPLEVPPDLSEVPIDASRDVPSLAGEAISAGDSEAFSEFQKFEKWEQFEEYREWKSAQGEELTFDDFKQAKADQGEDVTELFPVSFETDEQGVRQIRVRDEYANVWQRVGQALGEIEAKTKKSEQQAGWIQVKYKAKKQGDGVLANLRRASTFRVNLEQSDDGVLLSIQDKKGAVDSGETANQLLQSLYTRLKA